MPRFSSHGNPCQFIAITPGPIETSGIRIISFLMFFGAIYNQILYRNVFRLQIA